ncbi:sulfatase [uncultured Bilophila sp.]|uniref:sulfatase n=1 Tax=uncultured Bilophila sp. TaxID=529385 RepID=UPI0026DC77E1|nr:sulfatase [uncultured Bilophila sp.]
MDTPRNAIVLMFDTLSAKYVGCYGNEWIKTPNMDRLAREGVLFENWYTEGLPTVPCRRAMLTGRYTLPKSGWVALSMDDTTIADLCWGRPIDTALVFDCPMFRLPKFGYTRGFDKVWFLHGHEADEHFFDGDPLIHMDVDDYFDETSCEKYSARSGSEALEAIKAMSASLLSEVQYWKTPEDRYVAKTIKKAVEYLRQVDRNKQFFLWIDSFDPHEPWLPPSTYMGLPCPYDPDWKGKDEFMPLPDIASEVYTEEQLHHIRMLYAELVTLCDTWLGHLMDAIRELGLESSTLLMMVSDHGSPQGNGEWGHGLMRKCRPWPYEELAHAPVIARCPGVRPGQRIRAFTQSCDVAPTVCDWLGIGVHPDMQGKSLLPLMRGEVDKVRDFAVAGYYDYSWAIYTEDWSYIHWLTDAETAEVMRATFYSKSVPKDHLEAMGRKGFALDQDAMKGAEKAEPLEGKTLSYFDTLDGKDQWTCTPLAVADVPERDELYDRRTDRNQQCNVINDYPEIAAGLLKTLQNHMAELYRS